MNKILVPIDFSGPSDWGFYYAYHLAQQLEASLHVVHLYRPPYTESTMPKGMIEEIHTSRKDELLRHLRANAHPPIVSMEEQAAYPVEIHYIMNSGANADIADIAKQENVDLIVMGTHGAGNAFNKVWGSQTAKVIEKANCPVLAIPSGAEYDNVRNIAYATDYDPDDVKNILQLALFAKAINAKVHCVHIENVTQAPNQALEDSFKKEFMKHFDGMPVTFSIRSSISVLEGLQTFLRVNHIDILSMLTHKRNLWDRLFGESSVTKSMALKTEIPLLAFHA